MNEMRIVTVRQPWAWAIIHGGKDVENRVRNIAGAWRGSVAIHAGLAKFEEEGAAYVEVQRAIHSEWQGYPATDDQLWEVADDVDPDDPRFVYGAILGVVDLVDVHQSSGDDCIALRYNDSGIYRPCSPWAQEENYHMVLANPRPLAVPIPYKGALGLRRLDEETTAAVWSQIRGDDA